MNAKANPAISSGETTGTKFKNAAIAAGFALILLLPKLLSVRRHESSWLIFRLLLGLLGAALVIFPLGFWGSLWLPLIGLALFISAILLPPAKRNTDTIDSKCRELGALVVVNGGSYQSGNAPAAAAQLYIGVDHIWALDKHLQPLVVIPVREITSAKAESSVRGWSLRIRWNDHAAEFHYRGVFSQHLARVAESSIKNVLRPGLPVLPQRRAAGV